ncbi:MAG: hypothetical protein HQK76_20085 [Desulfobacterales bacterium]|nr:hypothetical protein [Desulfobacterales bacterium]
MVIIGFSGSRRLSVRYALLAQGIAHTCVKAGYKINVGCANGLDAFIREAVPSAKVFSVKSGFYGAGKSAYVKRSIDLIKSSNILIGFVNEPCPSGIIPADRWTSGIVPSGTWSSLALAVGLNIPVYIFCCSSDKIVLPRWSGKWKRVISGILKDSLKFFKNDLPF